MRKIRYETVKEAENTIESVVKERLCTSCGTCAGVCKQNAITMSINSYGIYVPIINTLLCNNCGICLRVCPGPGFAYSELHRRLHGVLPKNAALGSYLECYTGYTTNSTILSCSQSGGFISTLLLFCIEKKIIDGAVVTRWQPNNPLKAETYIARERNEILSAVGSKYNPIPASQIISTILKEEGKIAFVGTPCQIHGMRKAEKIYPELVDKIAVYIGLHCLGVFTYHFHDHILHKVGLNRSELSYFRHRDKASGGWPCGMRLEDINGNKYDLDQYNSRLWPRPYFTNWRCLLCFDKANEFSDISCGDCRIPEEHQYFVNQGYELEKGLSEFVVRTERGRQIVSWAINENNFVIHKTDADSVACSIGVAGKKLGLNIFSIVARIFNTGMPEYGVRFIQPEIKKSHKWMLLKPWSILLSCQYYIRFFLNRYAFVRWILKRIPHNVFSWLNKIFYIGVDWVKYEKSTKIIVDDLEEKKM